MCMTLRFVSLFIYDYRTHNYQFEKKSFVNESVPNFFMRLKS